MRVNKEVLFFWVGIIWCDCLDNGVLVLDRFFYGLVWSNKLVLWVYLIVIFMVLQM